MDLYNLLISISKSITKQLDVEKVIKKDVKSQRSSNIFNGFRNIEEIVLGDWFFGNIGTILKAYNDILNFLFPLCFQKEIFISLNHCDKTSLRSY